MLPHSLHFSANVVRSTRRPSDACAPGVRSILHANLATIRREAVALAAQRVWCGPRRSGEVETSRRWSSLI